MPAKWPDFDEYACLDFEGVSDPEEGSALSELMVEWGESIMFLFPLLVPMCDFCYTSEWNITRT
jgi:hypothetical protein